MTGDGATNWAAVFNHPAAHLLLEMRNPQQDTRILKFRAELIDKSTGETAVGLCTASQSDNETELWVVWEIRNRRCVYGDDIN